MSASKPRSDESLFLKAIQKYQFLLYKRPLLTKSCTSFTLAALGSLVAQIKLNGVRGMQKRVVFAYGATGFLYVAPLMHFFYAWLEKNVPQKKRTVATGVLRVLIDRLVVAPPFLLGYFYILSILEGLGHTGAIQKIKDTFKHILITNIKVWSIFQYINVNYVPAEFRVLCANCLAFFWAIYVTIARN